MNCFIKRARIPIHPDLGGQPVYEYCVIINEPDRPLEIVSTGATYQEVKQDFIYYSGAHPRTISQVKSYQPGGEIWMSYFGDSKC